MLYFVDGYNITKSDPATRDLSLEAQRDALVARLRTRGSSLLGDGRIVVVFDGAGGSGSGANSTSGAQVEVRFARTGSADDLLASLASSATEKVCLVSDDRELRNRVRVHAAHGSEERGRETVFDSATPKRARTASQRYPSSTAGLPKGANRVTEELKKLWLDEGE